MKNKTRSLRDNPARRASDTNGLSVNKWVGDTVLDGFDILDDHPACKNRQVFEPYHSTYQLFSPLDKNLVKRAYPASHFSRFWK